MMDLFYFNILKIVLNNNLKFYELTKRKIYKIIIIKSERICSLCYESKITYQKGFYFNSNNKNKQLNKIFIK